MVTPPITCDNYTYQIVNTTGETTDWQNLTRFNDTIYYFNFTQAISGDYKILLCDYTSREIYVHPKETTMIANMMSLIIMVIVFGLVGFLGFLNKDKGAMLFGFGVALAELVIIPFIIYAKSVGGDFSGILRINFYVVLFVCGGVGLIALIRYVVHVMSLKEDKEEGEEGRKWGR